MHGVINNTYMEMFKPLIKKEMCTQLQMSELHQQHRSID
jgi:hypothetical protein